jgi:hypothetical protein
MEEQNKNTKENPKSFGKGFITTLIFGLIVFWLVRSCFSKDEPTKVYTLAKVSGKLVDGNYVIDINLLDSNENMIILDDKKLYKGYSARILMFENDSWYGFDYDFKELNDKNLKSCILDTTVKLQNVKIKRNSMVLTLPKKEKINRSSTAWFAYQLIDPKGKIIGEGNADYSDFKFEVDQEKSSDYEITLNANALKVSDGELSRAFAENEIAADEKYKGRLVEVTGRIDDFGKSSYGDIQYILHGSSGGGGIQCVLCEVNNKDHKEKYIGLKNGQTVTIRGYVQGLVGEATDLEKAFGKTKGDNVFLEKCIIK